MPTLPSLDIPPLDQSTRAVTWLRVAMVAVVAGSLLLLAYVGWTTHQQALDQGRARIARSAQIAQEQAKRIVETNEVINRSIAAALEGQSNEQLRARGPELHRLLRGLGQDLEQLQSIWVWDEQGRPVASSLRPDPPATLNVSDREYFKWARSGEGGAWYVSEPLRSRVTGQLFFDFCVRRQSPDGRFAGAISVSLLPEYFDAFFREQLRNEPGFTLSLIRADGTIISRHPPPRDRTRLGPDSPLLAAMRAGDAFGETRGVSSIDAQQRHVAYRRVGDLPLYAVATASRDALLQPWRESMTLLTLFTLPLAFGLAAICWFAMRRVQREHAIALAHGHQYEQRLRAEEALRQSQKMEALGRLTGGVAHDFNNVLMVVQSSVAVARKLEERGRPVSSALAPIERAVKNGAQLTRQLLAVARRQPLQIQSVRLQEVLPAVGQLMGSTLGRMIQVECEVAPDAGTVGVDQAELELALINLCINARDAMPEGGVVRIRASAALPPEGTAPSTPWVRISVEDTGEGIPPELLPKVTEPFFTTKPYGKGTGLGLSQVHGFVQQSAGRLEITSEPGQGTKVVLWLPCVALPDAAQAPAVPVVESLDAHVLVVEDNPDIATALTTLLEHAGARVSRKATAEAALAALADGTVRPDVVLSDINLGGGLNGVDLARALRDEHPALKVVLMTGYTDRLQEATALGYQVLPKPAPPHQVLSALTQAMAAGSRGA